MRGNKYIRKAKEFFEFAKKEIEKSKRNDKQHLAVDGCEKAWLATVLATKGLFVKKGTKKEKELPKNFRGLLYFLHKYGTKEMEKTLGYLRTMLHSEGFYNQHINYELIETAFEELEDYVRTIEKI
jgi:hypothetical protein